MYSIINFIICGPISYWWWNFSKKSIFIVEHKTRALHRKVTLDRNQTQSTHVEVIGVENPKKPYFTDLMTKPPIHTLSRMAMFNLASTKATAKKDPPPNNCHYLQVPKAS